MSVNVLERVTKEYKLGVSEKEYPALKWIINPDLSHVQGVPVDYWLISGDSVKEMDSAQRAAVDAEMLPVEKAAKTQEFIRATADFGESRYSLARQQILAVLRAEARFDGLVNRSNYLGKLLDWSYKVLDYFDTKNAELQAMTTRDEVAGFTWDFSDFVNSDPLVTIYAARQIPD